MKTTALYDPSLDVGATSALPELRGALLEILRDRLARGELHQLVHGPVGSGRALLLAQLAAAVGDRWLVARPSPRPLLRPSDLWVDVARRLAPGSFRDRLPAEEDARAGLALEVLDGLARVEGRPILVLWHALDEDLARLDHPARALRDALARAPQVRVVATAAAPLSSAGPVERGLAERFEHHAIGPLDEADLRALAVALGAPVDAEVQARLGAVTALLGAWPAVIGRWAGLADAPVGDALVGVLACRAEADALRLAALPAQARAVLEGLAGLEGPSTAHELAAALELDVNAVSSQLSRLGRAGLVVAGRRPDTGRAAFLVADRPLALGWMARGAGRARLIALAEHLASVGEGGPGDHEALQDDLGRCDALVAQSRAEEASAPLSRLLETAARVGLGWTSLRAPVWSLLRRADAAGRAALTEQIDESAYAERAWLHLAAARLDRGDLARLLPEAVAPVARLMDELR